MLESSTIRFTTDTFGGAVEFVEEPLDGTTDPDAPDNPQPVFMKTAFLVSKVALDCSQKSAVDNFLITGNEPTGSSRRVIFKIDDALYKFKNGTLATYNDQGEFDDVIKYGNKVAVLNALIDLSAFVGKKIYPIIALQAPSDAADFPTIKIALATRSSNDQLTNTVDSPVYELADDLQTITDISAVTNCTGSGSVSITVRLRKNNSWTSYMTFADAVDKDADAVQFRMKYQVATADGSDSAQVQSITVKHTSGATLVTGNVANLYSSVANYETALRTCYVVVRHAPLVDSAIEGYVNFMDEPKHRELITIGTATGSRQELTLGEPDANIVASSIKLYANGEPIYDFDFSTELSTVILTATRGAVLTASYDYDYGSETWLRMTADDPQPYLDDDGTYSTRFSYVTGDDAKKMSNVRIRLRRLSGSSSGKLGTATGKTQLFTLKHKPVPESIAFTENVKHTYDEATGILSCVAAKNTTIYVNYDYLGDAPIVYSYAAGWSAA